MINKAKKLLNGAHVCSSCGHIAHENDSNPVQEFFHFTEIELYLDGFFFWLCEECNRAGRDFSKD